MNILAAPCAYKGTFSASALATAIDEGVRLRYPDATVVCAPIADGGDGTIEAIHLAVGGVIESVTAQGPLGRPHQANWLRIGELGVVELASACGLALIQPSERRALNAHTFGLGQVMLDCRNRGCAEVVVCVGGSASTDGGAGLLTALGAKFLDSEGKTLVPGGGALLAIDGCDVGPLDSWSDISVSIAVDVENPLLGPKGAAAIFGPQKGADTAQVELLDRALTRFADVLEGATGRAVRAMPGTGAAGGTAFGLACGLGARIISGFDWIAALIELERKIAEADCVITAEGRLDSQSLFGKGIGGLARMCRAANKPLLAVPALVEEGIDWPGQGIAKVLAAALDGNAATLNDVSNAVSVLIS